MNARPDDQPFTEDGRRQQWDNVAAGWEKWWQTIERGAQSVSRRMVELAEVVPGQRVLDIATGIGEPALLAARRVGPSGRVLATDLSPRMLAIAQERATALGLTNVEFMEVDASHLPFSHRTFDTILCRWGITSIPRYSDVLTAIRGMLTPVGTFVTAVWEEGARSRPLAALATALVQEIVDSRSSLPEPPSAPGTVRTALERDMVRAGFRHVHTEEMTLTLEFASTDDCRQYLQDVSPDVATSLSGVSTAHQVQFGKRLAAALLPYLERDGSVVIPNVTLCAVGRP